MATRVLQVFCWFIFIMCAITIGTEMMTASNDIEVIAGLALIVASVVLSYKSRFFTRLSFKKFKRLFKKKKE